MLVEAGRVFLFAFAASAAKTWRFDSDIANPANWEGAAGCRGVHFAAHNTAPVYIKELTAAEITLPGDGQIGILDGGFIEFKDNKKCVKLKPIDYRNWYDHDSWVPPDNVATPHQERIPCDHDDVVFPKILHTRVFEYLGTTIPVGAIWFGKEPITSDQLASFMKTSPGRDIFFNPIDPFSFQIEKKQCGDPYGCLCHTNYVPCPPVRSTAKLPCLEPVEPENFCDAICGAYITYKPGTGPDLGTITKKLAQYSAQTHASRVQTYLGSEVVQVVFTEKDYTGTSIEEAEDFLKYLQQSRAESAQLLKSGHYYAEGSTGSSWSIVFGSLVAVCVFFGILFYLHGDPFLDAFLARFNKGRGSVFNVPFFARFDNTDENLIIDGQSESGSILDIAKSFDNPMYGQEVVPTTSTEHENPLYEATKEDAAALYEATKEDAADEPQ